MQFLTKMQACISILLNSYAFVLQSLSLSGKAKEYPTHMKVKFCRFDVIMALEINCRIANG